MISVCLATYNGEKYIKKQLDSILCQLSSDDEIIVSDDGSKDSTIQIIESYNDKRIKIINHPHQVNPIYPNSNVGSVLLNFEESLKHAKGDYIFLSDQDDIWRSDKVEKSISLLQENCLVASNFSIIDENDNVTNESYFKESPYHNSTFRIICKSPFLGCAMAFTKEVLDKCLPMNPGVFIHDLWIGLVANKIGKVVFTMEPLFSHRISSTNTSTFAKKSTNPIPMRIKFRLYNLWELRKIHK